ncbi:MAG: hypothetical protein JXA71_15475 [Chitinispirillaceae bacterium]|nr:hypothetical protein [Chitinispirillaceae bacterium]
MPRDTAHLTVNDTRIDDLISYDVDSDLYIAADAFEFNVLRKGSLAAGDIVRFYVNDKPALTGVVNRLTAKSGKREGVLKTLAGTDMMGMLCGHCSAALGDIVAPKALELNVLVGFLIDDLPKKYVRGMNDIVFQKGTARLSISFEHVNASPGQTVFDILRTAASSRGLLFWCDEDGKFNFGKPLSHGRPVFDIVRRSSGNGNNVITGQTINDIEDGFSKVKVYCQSQSDGDYDANNVSASAELSVPDEFPFYRLRTVQINVDKTSPSLEAKRLINQVRASLFRYEYMVPGHSQKGLNYRANEMAHIDDDDLDVHGDFLIYGRKFTCNKETGPATQLRLGIPGVVFNAA